MARGGGQSAGLWTPPARPDADCSKFAARRKGEVRCRCANTEHHVSIGNYFRVRSINAGILTGRSRREGRKAPSLPPNREDSGWHGPCCKTKPEIPAPGSEGRRTKAVAWNRLRFRQIPGLFIFLS